MSAGAATPSTGAPAGVSVDAERLVADLAELSEIGRGPGGGIDRASFSPADRRAREWLRDRVAAAGLAIAEDGIGNLFISAGDEDPASPDGPAVWTGSHLDAVPNGGSFDGALGTIAALECVRRIAELGIRLPRPLRAVVYSDEEGDYAHLLGSTALTRGYTPAELEAMRSRTGVRFVDAFREFGGDLEQASRTKLAPGLVHASVELHIEQGPVLEARGHRIGVVTGIVGIGGGEIVFRGRADHAGTTPMDLRRDASLGAGALVVALPELAGTIDARAVATSGIVVLEPGSSNVIAEAARVTVDFRHPTADGLVALEAGIVARAGAIAEELGLEVELDLEPLIAPATLDPGIQEIIARAADERGLAQSEVPSGAGHDSQNLATIAPTGMIFVPSVGGRSHCPEEFTEREDVVNGANVLLDTVIRLANG